MAQATLNYGRDDPTRHAMAAIDIALWDLRGKVEGKPVHALLGGARRERVRAYASHPLGRSIGETADAARRLVAQGFTAVKFGWHPLGLDAEADEAIVRTLREAIGPGRDLLIDAGMAWDVPTAIARCERFAPYRLFWLEEPLQARMSPAIRRLPRPPRRRSPLARWPPRTRSLPARRGARRRRSAGRRVAHRPDGGDARRRTGRALRRAVRQPHLLIPPERRGFPPLHGRGSRDGALPRGPATSHRSIRPITRRKSASEHQAAPNQMRDRLDQGQLAPRDGWVTVPSGPGLGVEVDEEALRFFRTPAAG